MTPEKKSPWEVISTQRILDSHYLKIRSEHVKLPNGVLIPDYYIIENRGWVGILPFTEDGRFLINRQYKHGIGEEVLEFPAGMIEEGEEPLETAHRELMEETGYSIASDEIEFLAEMVANPTGAQARIWWYLGRNARKTGVQNFDPGEDIQNFLVMPAELLALIHSGQFNIPGHIAAAYMALERLGFLKTQF
jgi:ADP-ribose pyrophosphatase